MTIGKANDGMKSISKTWHNNSGSRIESEMNIPGMGMKKTIMLMLKSNPNVIINIDNEKKSYSEVKTDPESNSNEDFTVEILGKEKVGSFNCTHAKVKSKDTEFEVWTTKDIADYKELYNSSFMQKQTKGANKSFMSGELEGMMVRMKNINNKEAFTMELMKFEKGSYPQSMFEIPAGYTKGASFDPSKMQQMSQEERQKMMEELMKQYGKEEK